MKFKAGFSLDFGVAGILVILAVAVLFSAYKIGFSEISFKKRIGEREKIAIFTADYLIKNCKEAFGIANCDKRYIYSHVLSKESVESVKKNFEKLKEKLGIEEEISIKIYDLQGYEFLNIGKREKEKICIKRFLISEEMKEMILEVCV